MDDPNNFRLVERVGLGLEWLVWHYLNDTTCIRHW